MEYLVGAVLGLLIGILTSVVGMDRDRALYPVALIVIASYYDLFAVMGGSDRALVIELAVGLLFVGLAVAAFKSTLWLAVIGIVGHGLFDLVHNYFIHNPGLPDYWPGFCSSIDIVLGIYLAWRLATGRIPARPTP